MKLFHSATLKLTLWYLAILMSVSVAFSVAIYNISSQEFNRPLPAEFRRNLRIDIALLEEIREGEVRAAQASLLTRLFLLNLVTLGAGTVLSYYFARRSLQPIEDALDAQTRFVSDASHELRTPLAVIRTENEIALRDKKPSVSSLTSVVTSNLEEIERLQLLTDRLLALSTEQELPLTALAVEAVVRDAISRHELAAKHKKMSLTSDVSDLMASGHSETVCDILSILIDNAIKYSPRGSAVAISCSSSHRHVLIAVTDQGQGVAEQDLPHIFDRFYRADVSRSSSATPGYGLGLALAKKLSELNDGELTVDNVKPHGARFTLMLSKSK